MALFPLVDEELEHGLHLGQLLSCLRGGLELLRPVVHDGRDGVDGVIQTVRVVVVSLSGRSAERGGEARLDRRFVVRRQAPTSAGATRSAPSP